MLRTQGYLRVKEAAALLGVSPNTVSNGHFGPPRLGVHSGASETILPVVRSMNHIRPFLRRKRGRKGGRGTGTKRRRPPNWGDMGKDFRLLRLLLFAADAHAAEAPIRASTPLLSLQPSERCPTGNLPSGA